MDAKGTSTPNRASKVLGKRLAKDSGVTSTEQSNLHERSTAASFTPSRTTGLTTPCKQSRMSMIRPTHSPGTLQSSIVAEAAKHPIEMVEVQLTDSSPDLDKVDSLAATMVRSTSPGPDIGPAAEN